MPTTKNNNLYSIVLLNSIYPLSKPLNKFFAKALVCSTYKKGDHIVRNGEVCDRIHIIRKGLVNHGIVADAEINLSATLIELSQIK